MKSWLQDNGIEMFSTYNEGKYVVAERCVETLENRIYKYMNLLSNNATYWQMTLHGLINATMHILAQLIWTLFM